MDESEKKECLFTEIEDSTLFPGLYMNWLNGKVEFFRAKITIWSEGD